MDGKKLPAGIKGALIDMDGVLYDSMPYHAKAWYAMFTEAGVKTDPDEFFLYEGMTGGATIDMIFRRELGRGATEQERKDLYARKADFFVDFGQKKMMPGALRMLEALRNGGVNTILVTGSAQGSLLDSLDTDYPGFFPKERRVTALDVKRGKPDPEPYLKGLAKSGTETGETIVIENAPLGVRSGKASGCFTIAVATGPIPLERFEEEGADLIFPDMNSFADFLEKEISISLCSAIDKAVEDLDADKTIVITDENVAKKVLSRLKDSIVLAKSPWIVLPAGEDSKNMESVADIWKKFEEAGATRKSVAVNIGGGLITDIGGFAASTFKRGIRTVNVPTTLLGAVDAATGGKTGINFQGLKNEIGSFHLPSAVVISAEPLSTLSRRELLSGYAEMVKTALIADAPLYAELLDVETVLTDKRKLEKAMKRCVGIKDGIVAQDPKETGLRKVLNFGHTAGHAFESLSFERKIPLTHGEAVAHGILVELILSNHIEGLDKNIVKEYAEKILIKYPDTQLNEKEIERLIELMSHDKKNRQSGKINFTLIRRPGEPEINCEPDTDILKVSLQDYLQYSRLLYRPDNI